MKRAIVSIAFVLIVFGLPCRSNAESTLDVVLWDSLVGAGIGALAGTATLAFMDHPSDHLERIAQGASLGIIAGIGFGFYEISPVVYSRVDSKGQRERVYGLQFNFALK
jgi:hypothetical protein